MLVFTKIYFIILTQSGLSAPQQCWCDLPTTTVIVRPALHGLHTATLPLLRCLVLEVVEVLEVLEVEVIEVATELTSNRVILSLWALDI